jgi:hypothetical protein
MVSKVIGSERRLSLGRPVSSANYIGNIARWQLTAMRSVGVIFEIHYASRLHV